LKTAVSALTSLNLNAIISSLIGVIFALAVPITLLGCISPFAIRLAVQDVSEAGRISGRIYAISTWGSLLGTYLPVLVVIPLAGTRLTADLFGTFLFIIGLIGQTHAKNLSLPSTLATLLLVPAIWFWAGGNITAHDGQIFETESAYNYIQVVRQEDCNYLLLNEGQAYHSFYCDNGRVPRISVWSIMLVAPYFNAEPSIQNMAVIGLAAGTIPKQFTRVFGPIPIDGVELDPAIVQVGRDYFALTEPNINVIVGDGRYQLNQLHDRYDIITIDAYKVPYIPWHLTTREFFQEVKAHLTDKGVVAMNVGRAPDDRRLVDAITATLLQVYPTVHALDVPGSLNTILVATVQPTTAASLQTNLTQLGEVDPLLREAVATAVSSVVPTTPSDVVFTDERAPVETIIDSLVIRYLLAEGVSGLPGLGG
jgi:spermidine synthase